MSITGNPIIIEIFNKGKSDFTFRVSTRNKWLKISETQGTVYPDKRIWISIDWDKVPKGKINGMLKITGASREVQVNITVNNPMRTFCWTIRWFC